MMHSPEEHKHTPDMSVTLTAVGVCVYVCVTHTGQHLEGSSEQKALSFR